MIMRFQSRNRESFIFYGDKSKKGSNYDNMFQSRNRESFIFYLEDIVGEHH